MRIMLASDLVAYNDCVDAPSNERIWVALMDMAFHYGSI